MRRASSSDRASVGPVRVRNDENNPPRQNRRSSSLNRQSVGSRSMMGNGRQSLYGRQSISGTNRKSVIPMSKASQVKRPRLSSATPRKSNLGVRGGAAKDPRPISDRGFQQRCIKTVLEFLTANGYPYNITPKILQSPTAKDFYKIFEFIMSYLIPNYKIPPKPEDEIPKMLKVWGYPFLISKTSMFAIGTPHTWPHMLAALVFLIDIITYNMRTELQAESMLFAADDFDSKPERQIVYQYMERCYNSYMDGNDEFEDEDLELKAAVRQKFLGIGGIDEKLEEHRSLEEQVALLDQDTDRLKTYLQNLQRLQHDEERYHVYLSELETHKRQQEMGLNEAEEQLVTLETEMRAKEVVIEKMREIEQQQEFSQEDVERIHLKGRELKRQIVDLEKSLQSFNEDIWKEEMAMTKELEGSEEKRRAYNKLGLKLKLIPISAENSGGVDYEMRKATYNDSPADFQTIIKPALMTLKMQCSESANKKASEKIKLQEQLEQVHENLTDMQNQVSLMESKYKRADDEVEGKRQLYQKEVERLQEMGEEIQNEIVQLASVSMLAGIDVNSEKRKIKAWGTQECMKAEKRLTEYKVFFQEALQAIMEHMEVMQSHVKQADDKIKKEHDSVIQDAKERGMDLSKLTLSE